MPFALQSFLAAQSAGDKINADLDNTRADAALKMQQIAQGQQMMDQRTQQMQAQKEQQAQMTKLMDGFDQEKQAKQIETGQAPDGQKEVDLQTESAHYRQLGKTFAITDPAKMESWYKMADAADGKLAQLQSTNLEIGKKRAASAASYAGAVLSGDVSPDEAFKWVKDNVSLKEAMAIPADPVEAKKYWRTKQNLGLTAAEQLANAQKVQDAADKADALEQARQDRLQFHKDNEADKAAMREVLKSNKADSKEAKIDKAAQQASAAEFRQTEQLNKKLQLEAKPFLEDKRRMDEIEGLLEVNSSAADQQIHQALTSVLGNFKGRATNKFYADNKNFGSVASRMSGFLSHAFAGRYQDSDRLMIRDMMEKMKSDAIEPALAQLESQTKSHAEGYKLDPKQIEITGDFNRQAKAPVPKTTQYTEGQIATNPTTGAKLVFKQGKWIPQ